MNGGVKITYLGQCGFLLDFGMVRIVTDPYLSNSVDTPGDDDWTRKYPAPYTLKRLKPDCVVISHAHGDHMDIATLTEYANADGRAMVCAPAPECHRLGATGLPEVAPARAETPFGVGNVSITPIACAHRVFHVDESGDFRELSYFIEGNGVKLFFGGDMSLYPGLEARLMRENPALMLLPVNGADEARESRGVIGNINCEQAAELAKLSKLNAFIPMHHDLYTGNGETNENIIAAAKRAGTRALILKPGEMLEFTGE